MDHTNYMEKIYNDLIHMDESEQKTKLIKLYIGLFESFTRPYYIKQVSRDKERKEIKLKNNEKDIIFIKQLKELLL